MRKTELKVGDVINGVRLESYVNAHYVLVKFEKTGNLRWTTGAIFRSGSLRDTQDKLELELTVQETYRAKKYREKRARLEERIDREQSNRAKRLALRKELELLDVKPTSQLRDRLDDLHRDFENKNSAAAQVEECPEWLVAGAPVLYGPSKDPYVVTEYTPGLPVKAIHSRDGREYRLRLKSIRKFVA